MSESTLFKVLWQNIISYTMEVRPVRPIPGYPDNKRKRRIKSKDIVPVYGYIDLTKNHWMGFMDIFLIMMYADKRRLNKNFKKYILMLSFEHDSRYTGSNQNEYFYILNNELKVLQKSDTENVYRYYGVMEQMISIFITYPSINLCVGLLQNEKEFSPSLNNSVSISEHTITDKNVLNALKKGIQSYKFAYYKCIYFDKDLTRSYSKNLPEACQCLIVLFSLLRNSQSQLHRSYLYGLHKLVNEMWVHHGDKTLLYISELKFKINTITPKQCIPLFCPHPYELLQYDIIKEIGEIKHPIIYLIQSFTMIVLHFYCPQMHLIVADIRDKIQRMMIYSIFLIQKNPNNVNLIVSIAYYYQRTKTSCRIEEKYRKQISSILSTIDSPPTDYLLDLINKQ